MKILITGGKGQLGTEIFRCFERGFTELGVPDLLQEKNEVRAIDMDELDVADLKAVRCFFRENRYDAVINCAAYTNVDGCEEHKDDAFRANALAPRNLSMLCGKMDMKLLHISTDYVFPGTGSKPYSESDLPAPKSAYGSTKYWGEQYVRDFSKKYFIVRTAWLYGYYGKNFVKTIMSAARKTGSLTVVSDQRGNPTNAADLAHHLIKLLTTEEYGIYHATGAGECSWFDFAEEIVRSAGIEAAVKPCTSEEYAVINPKAASRPKYSALDHQMLRFTVGDEFRPWQDALHSFMDHYKEQGDGLL